MVEGSVATARRPQEKDGDVFEKSLKKAAG